MRELTDSEQKILGEARQEYEPEYVGYTIEELAGFDSGFIAALDYQQAQLAALQAENRRLREAQFKAVKDLKGIVKGWREYAAGDYCQTYNPERGKGLNSAADHLENYVHDAYRGE